MRISISIDCCDGKFFEIAKENGIDVLCKEYKKNEKFYFKYFSDVIGKNGSVLHVASRDDFCAASAAACKLENVYVVDARSCDCTAVLVALYAKKLADKAVEDKKIFVASIEKAKSVYVDIAGVNMLDVVDKKEVSFVQRLKTALSFKKPLLCLKNGTLALKTKIAGGIKRLAKTMAIEAKQKATDKRNVFVLTTGKGRGAKMLKKELEKQGFSNVSLVRPFFCLASKKQFGVAFLG